MALSGNFSTNKYTTSSHGTIGLNLSWTGTQNIVNNTTTIKWTLKSNGTMSSGYYVQAGPVTVTINGTKVLNTTSRFNMKGDGAYKKSGTITVSHGEDGSKTVSMSVKAAIYSASVNCTASKSYTLDKINRYALISSITDFNDDGYPTMVYTNPAGTGLTTQLKGRLTWNNGESYTDWVTLNDEGGTYTWDSSTLDSADRDSMYDACLTSNHLTVKADLQSTMNGVEYHHYKECTMTVTSAAPDIDGASYADTNPTTKAIMGSPYTKTIQNMSTIAFSFDKLTSFKKATLTSLSVKYKDSGQGGVVASADLSSMPQQEGDDGEHYIEDLSINMTSLITSAENVVLTISLTDSRGCITDEDITILVFPWVVPSATTELGRRSGFYSLTDIKVNCNYSTLDGNNTMYIYCRWKKTSDPDYDPQDVAQLYNGQGDTLDLPNSYDWDLQVFIYDKVLTNTQAIRYDLTVKAGIPNVFFDNKRNSVGINCIPSADNDLQVNGASVVNRYSENERAVGFWTDGRIIYEKFVQLSSAVTVNANAWNDNVCTFSSAVIIIKAEPYYVENNNVTFWGFMASHTISNNLKLGLYNSRNASCQVSHVKIQYVYLPT